MRMRRYAVLDLQADWRLYAGFKEQGSIVGDVKPGKWLLGFSYKSEEREIFTNRALKNNSPG